MGISERNLIHVLLSSPIRVHWAGWETTTTQLQQAGWQLSAEEDFQRMRLRIAFKHNLLRVYAVSEATAYDFYRARFNNFDTRGLVLNVRYFANDLRVQVMDDFSGFKPIDAYPQVIQREVKSIEDFGIFAVPLARTEEIIVNPADVSALLEQIKQIQLPEQAEIRKRERQRDYRGMEVEARPQQKFHAQIVSLVA